MHQKRVKLVHTESEKDGEPRNQDPEEGFASEEGWNEMLNILLHYFSILPFGGKLYQKIHENSEKSA